MPPQTPSPQRTIPQQSTQKPTQKPTAQKSTPQESTKKPTQKPTETATARKSTQKSTAQKSTPQESTKKSTQKPTEKATTQKSTEKSTENPTAQKSDPSPDVGKNWYVSVVKTLTSMVGGENGNTSDIKGNDNHVVLIGNDNKNDLHGDKNLIAEDGVNNNNTSVGDSNKIGLKGTGILHTPQESINNIIIFLQNGLTSGDQQTGNKGGNDEANLLQQIRRMCKRYLPKEYKW